jgi:alpha-beta hydrolase superfamily lysophospholipase
VIPGLRHEIFNEPERESVFADLLGWMHKQGRS